MAAEGETGRQLLIALAQAEPMWGPDPAASAAAGEAWCRRAAAAGADLVLMPEMWSHGYWLPDPDDRAAVERWAATAVARDGEYVAAFCRLAAELGVAVGLTYLEASDGLLRNTLTLVDRRGLPVLHYAKVHTCAWDGERLLTPGDDFPVATLLTRCGPVEVGGMICFDREFPESARVLMLRGAELILVPNACRGDDIRIAQLAARSYENMAAIAMANYAGETYRGRSMAFDGRAFGEDERGRDMILAEGGAGEELVLATLDLAALRRYRAREVWGDAYRRPEAYGDLVREPQQPPAVRRLPRCGVGFPGQGRRRG
jgi:predicted amidohydrolase